jgi:glycosyltransferase involved in cell wall biosynthesis
MRRWICSQIGAREHYAVPRALEQAGSLEALYTDLWAGPVLRRVKVGQLRALAARHHPDLPSTRVSSWNFRAVAWEVELRRRHRDGGLDGKYQGFIDVGSRFATALRDRLKTQRHRLSRETSVFFGYDTGSLETFAWLWEQGIPCILDQMDPSRTEAALVRQEEEMWPGWSEGHRSIPEAYFQRREQEWSLASLIVVNSEFSRKALIAQGVPAEKLAVVPLCYEVETARESYRPTRAPLRVLFLGQVVLRKGIQYLIEAARLLRREPIRFDVVGPVGISNRAMRSAPANMVFHGRASRDHTDTWYRQSNLFVLPTLSDGFAVTQIEAMAHGLPVITTPNCGEVVTNGVDGFIVPARSAGELAERIILYLHNPAMLREHQQSALRKSRQFTIARLAKHLAVLDESIRV